MFGWAESPPDCTVIYVFAFSSLPTLTLRIITLSRVMNVLRGYIKWLNSRKQTFLLTPRAAGKIWGVCVLYVSAVFITPRGTKFARAAQLRHCVFPVYSRRW